MATAIHQTSGRTMTIGGVLSRATAAISAAPLIFFGTSFVLAALPYGIFSIMSGGTALVDPARHLATIWPAFAGIGLVWLLLYTAARAVLIRATIAQSEVQRETFGQTAASAARSLLPLAMVTILFWLSVWVGCILIVPGIILALMWAVAGPALITEGNGIVAAFGRSRYLTSGSRWRILGLGLVVFGLYIVLYAIFGAVSMALFGVMPVGIQAAGSVGVALLSVVMQTGLFAIWTAIEAALYLDLRDAKDGPAGDHLAEVFA